MITSKLPLKVGGGYVSLGVNIPRMSANSYLINIVGQTYLSCSSYCDTTITYIDKNNNTQTITNPNVTIKCKMDSTLTLTYNISVTSYSTQDHLLEVSAGYLKPYERYNLSNGTYTYTYPLYQNITINEQNTDLTLTAVSGASVCQPTASLSCSNFYWNNEILLYVGSVVTYNNEYINTVHYSFTYKLT